MVSNKIINANRIIKMNKMNSEELSNRINKNYEDERKIMVKNFEEYFNKSLEKWSTTSSPYYELLEYKSNEFLKFLELKLKEINTKNCRIGYRYNDNALYLHLSQCVDNKHDYKSYYEYPLNEKF